MMEWDIVFWLKEISYQLAVMNERNNGYDGGDLPIKPGINSHTYHYTPDTENK